MIFIKDRRGREGSFKDGVLHVKFYLESDLAYLLVNHFLSSSVTTKTLKLFLKCIFIKRHDLKIGL